MPPLLPQPSRRPGWVLPVVAGLAVLLLAAGGGIAYLLTSRAGQNAAAPVATTTPTPAAPPTTRPAILDAFSVGGIITLYDKSAKWKVGSQCEGKGGYSDIRVGADAVVSVSGQDVALGSIFLANGVSEQGQVVCKFGFMILGVPPNRGIYTLTIGHRPTKMTEEELRRDQDLSLGTP